MHPRADTATLTEIGGRLRAIRLACGLTQADVAKALGVDQSLWSKWERGQRTPDLLRLLDFARKAGASIELICNGLLLRTNGALAERLRDFSRSQGGLVLHAADGEPQPSAGFEVKAAAPLVVNKEPTPLNASDGSSPDGWRR